MWLDKEYIKKNFNLDNKDVLDFGCGMGGMSIWYASEWNCRVDAIDIDKHHIEIAKTIQKEFDVSNVTFYLKNVLDEDFNRLYDVIFLNDVIEHIPLDLLPSIVDKLSQLLRPQGVIYVSYPPWQSPYASHVNSIIKLPWCQYLPDYFVINYLKKHNRVIVGDIEGSLLEVYKGLNKMTHRKLMKIIKKANLHHYRRVSHTFFNKIKWLKGANLNIFPMLVTKEIILLRKK